ncbi:MAG: T9SS type A sorting domain-containing protein [Bacteroidia bacterium]
MKKLYIGMLLSLGLIALNAQTFNWAKREGLWAYDYGYGIANDAAGNVYLAGKYEMNAIFSGVTLPNQGNHDIYVAKYSPAGALTWIRTAGGYSGDYAHTLSCDNSYVYIGGEIEGSGNIIKFIGSSITLVPQGGNDAFVAKYDLNGNLLWARRGGGGSDDKCLGVTSDPSGNVYMCGYFNNQATFGSTTLYGSGNNDIFIAKLDPAGNFLWAKKAGSATRDEAKWVKCDAAGNVYICGMHGNGVVFGGQTFYNPDGYFNSFVAKYSTSGALVWVRSFGGVYDDVAWSLTVDKYGKIIVAGEFNSSFYAGNTHLITSGNADVYIIAYDANGNAVWARKAGGNQPDRARGIGTDGSNIFITGQFAGTANFGGTYKTSVDNSDIFFSCLNNSGQFLWTSTVGGPADASETLGYESGNAICAEATGNVYATGALLSGGVFGSTSLGAYSRTDVFITKLHNSFLAAREERVPITLNAQPKGKSVALTWPVEYANDSIYFMVERSSDDVSYETLGTVEINTNGIYSYNDTITADTPPKIYYRLRQSNKSGDYAYSNVIAINIDHQNNLKCMVFPNPAKSTIMVSVQSLSGKEDNQTFSTVIYDNSGMERKRSEIEYGQSAIDLNSLSPGMYLIIIRNGDQAIFKERVIVQ